MSEKKYFDLKNIKEMLGDDEVVKYMLQVFVESTPETLEELNQAYQQSNHDQLARSAHKMKASLDILKIDQLYDVVRTIDKDFKVKEMSKSDLDYAVNEMNRVLNLVFSQLKEDIKRQT
jgi:HPt (histidine-containing phosphotransfer) domain-containing protein